MFLSLGCVLILSYGTLVKCVIVDSGCR